MITPAVNKSRAIRELILRALYNTYLSGPSLAVLLGHIYELFRPMTVPYTAEEIAAELADLCEGQLIEAVEVPSMGPLPARAYRVLARGRDFFKANCPWSKLDEFTGGDRVA